MVKIAGTWDVNWLPSPLVEYNSRWKFLVLGFSLDGIYMTPVTGFAEDYRSPANPAETVIEVANIMDTVLANPGLTPVLVDERSSNMLQTFTHPPDALYVFGRTGESYFDGWQGLSVAVEAPGAFTPYLQPDQAAAIVLYDRMVKSWQ